MDGMRAGCSVVRSLKLSSGKTLEPKQTQRVPPLVETNDIHAIFRWQTAEDRKKTLEDPPDLLLANEKDIRRVKTKEKNTVPVVQNLSGAESIDFDIMNNLMYWTDMSLKKISSAYVNGSNVVEVAVRGLNEPRAILVDWVGHNIIWSDVDLRMREARNHEDLGRLCMMTYDATFTRIIAWKGLDVTWALAYDPATGFLYWSDVFNQTIQRIRLDGKDRSVVVLGCSADGLTIDFEENQLYWTDKLSNSIKLSNMDGSNQRTLIQNPSQLVYPYAVVTLGFYVYWTDLYKRAVLVAVKSTSQEKKIVEGQLLNPHDIGAFHIGRQPNFTSLCSTEESGCSHFCLSIPPGFVCACPTGVKLLSDGKTCAPGLEKFILFARGYDIRILSLDVPLSDTIDTKTLFPVHYVLAVAYDVVEDYIYWPDEDSNTGANVILRGRANSSTTEVVVKDMTALFDGLAVDWISRNLYFVDSNLGRIKVSRLDGSYEKTLIYTDLNIPRGIVVDPVEGYMYFSDIGKKAKIEKACMDGSNRSVLIQSNLQSPNVLALDFEARKLYWSDGAAHAIEFCDLWGEHRAHLLHLQQSGYPYGLAVSGSVLFWTDHMLKTLNRGQKENAGNHKILLDHVPTVYEMLLIDKTKRIGSNYCKKDNGGCSHLCLPRPEGRTCECPDWFQFKDAQKTQCSAPIPTLVYTHHTQQYGFLRAITLTANPTATTLDIPDKEVLSPVALANDVIEQKVYWSDLERNQIRRASLEKSTNTNGDMEVIIQFGAANLGGLAVDWMARNLYWTVIGRDQIDMARLDGSLRTPFKWVDVKKPVPLAVEPEEGLLYWASWSDPPHIQSARLSNSSDSQVLMTLSKPFQPNSMTIDHASRCLFWADANSRTISMINLRYKPLTRVTLLSGTSKIGLKPSGIAIFNNTLYWANFAQQQLEYIKVKKKPMSMKNAKTLAGIASIDDKVDMTIVDYKRQSSINQCKFKNGGCSHYCLSAEYQGFQCGCPVYLELARRTKNSPWEICNVPKALMMYSSKTDMYLVNLTNPNAMQNQTDAPIHLDIATDITHIEVDIEHSRIFWTNSKNWLYCSTFDGKESRLLVHRVTVFDMAVHHVTGQLFFTSEDSNAIEALWPDGRSVGVVMASQQLHPRSLALDSDAGNLYWTDWGENPSIRSASLDGSHHKLLIDSNLVAPTGLLVDESRGEMYWLDWKREVLEKSDLLGANRRSMLLEFKEPGSLAAGGHYLFYSVPSTGSILQLNKTIGGHLPVSSHAIPPEVMRSGLTNVTDVYVYESRLFPSNPCANDNGNCSHLCIPTGDGDHLCSCPMNSKLTDDHRTCSSLSCPVKDQVSCKDGSSCIDSYLLCDGQKQCQDGSDENECICTFLQTRCPTGECISKSELCDGIVSPLCNGWDESYDICTCPPGQKRCGGRGCFTIEQFCNDKAECHNGHDELYCDETNSTGPAGSAHESGSTKMSVKSIAIILSVGITVLVPVCILIIAIRHRVNKKRANRDGSPPAQSTTAATETTNVQQDSYKDSRVVFCALTEAALREKEEREESVGGVSVYVEGVSPLPRMPKLPSGVTDFDTDTFSMPPPMGGPLAVASEPLCDPPNSVVSGQESAVTIDSSVARRSAKQLKPSVPRYRCQSSESDYRPPAPCQSTVNDNSFGACDPDTSSEDDMPPRKRPPPPEVHYYPASPVASFSGSQANTDLNCGYSISSGTFGEFCPPPPPTLVSDYTETDV